MSQRGAQGPAAAGDRGRLIRHGRMGLCVPMLKPLLFPPWFSTESPLLDLPQYDVVHPTRVDARGRFLSNILSHHVRRVQRRDASERSASTDRVFYQLRHGGRSLRLNLTLNARLLAPGLLTERRYGGLEGAQIHAAASPQCHFLGDVWDEEAVKGSAAISTCDGLVSTCDSTSMMRIKGPDVFFLFFFPLDEPQCEAANAGQKVHV